MPARNALKRRRARNARNSARASIARVSARISARISATTNAAMAARRVAINSAVAAVAAKAALHLLPRKAVETPTVELPALEVLVRIALEAVDDVDHLGEPRRFERLTGRDRARA